MELGENEIFSLLHQEDSEEENPTRLTSFCGDGDRDIDLYYFFFKSLIYGEFGSEDLKIQ